MTESHPDAIDRLDWEQSPSDCCTTNNTTHETDRGRHLEILEYSENDANFDIYCLVRAAVGQDWEAHVDQQCGIDLEFSQQDLKASTFTDGDLDGHMDRECGLKKPRSSSTSPEEEHSTEYAYHNTTGLKNQKTTGTGTNKRNRIIKRGLEIDAGWGETTSTPSSIRTHNITLDMSQQASQSNGQGLPLVYYSRTNPMKMVASCAKISGSGIKEQVSLSAKSSRIPKPIAHPRGATSRIYRPTIRGSRGRSAFSTDTIMALPTEENQVASLGGRLPSQPHVGTLNTIPRSSSLTDKDDSAQNFRGFSVQSTTENQSLSRNPTSRSRQAFITPDVFHQIKSDDSMFFLFDLTHKLNVFNEYMATQLEQVTMTLKPERISHFEDSNTRPRTFPGIGRVSENGHIVWGVEI
ncbi:hypothetical protein HDK90DRAFT_466186 [Phyllosticta capitalensis]|uniref:Uncharacterized protein n=1 Tax=Phyllosticta capitalensis TaxID=121624 RepID=A0ABR1YR00_9PEZI